MWKVWYEIDKLGKIAWAVDGIIFYLIRHDFSSSEFWFSTEILANNFICYRGGVRLLNKIFVSIGFFYQIYQCKNDITFTEKRIRFKIFFNCYVINEIVMIR